MMNSTTDELLVALRETIDKGIPITEELYRDIAFVLLSTKYGTNESEQRDENIRNRSTYFGNE
jgi:hypothetical protein